MSHVCTVDPKTELGQRMGGLGIVGFSSMGVFSHEEQLAHLSEIERIFDGRRQAAQKMNSTGESVSLVENGFQRRGTQVQ